MANRILIVEDERTTAEDPEEVLKDLGYQVSAVVSSGEEAIREGERNQPDLAMMDIRIQERYGRSGDRAYSAGTL